MPSGKSTLKVAINLIKLCSLRKVSWKTPNRVSTTDLTAHEMRQLKVSMFKKYLITSLAMFENAAVPTLCRKKNM